MNVKRNDFSGGGDVGGGGMVYIIGSHLGGGVVEVDGIP
jgi:hypothetical protein